jgi:hypothetical protein
LSDAQLMAIVRGEPQASINTPIKMTWAQYAVKFGLWPPGSAAAIAEAKGKSESSKRESLFYTAAAVIPPVALTLIGMALIWALAGFKGT